jgi:hypothetical protein
MAGQLPIGRGPRSRDDWIALLAWAQLGAVLVLAAGGTSTQQGG